MAISVRGGPTAQKEPQGFDRVATDEAVMTTVTGYFKVGFIVHVVKLGFQEENTEDKLRITVFNLLKPAEVASEKTE